MIPKQGMLSLFTTCFCVILVCVNGVRIDFDQQNDGFFLKSAYYKLKPSNPTQEKELFVITKRAEFHKLKVNHGPFEAYQAVPEEFLDPSINKKVHSRIFDNADVSVHILTDELLQKWPQLQVLMHARFVKHPVKKGYSDHFFSREQWCGQLIVRHEDHRLTDVCLLNQNNQEACVLKMDIPADWWHRNTSNINIYYKFSRVEDNMECAGESNSIVPGRIEEEDKYLIGSMPLSSEDHRFEEKGDNRLIFRVPRTKYVPGNRFLVPVYLTGKSNVPIMVVQAKVKNGLKIRGAAVKPHSPWSVYFEMKDNQKTAVVTAFIKDKARFLESGRDEQIFSWEFEVSSEDMGAETGRIIWSIDYEKNRPTIKHHDSRISAKVQIVMENQKKIVLVFKESNILNTAILTGNKQTFPLKIYSIDKENKLQDVTFMTVCHSTDIEVIKVAPDCSEVYLNGDETQGAHNVTIITKTAYYTSFLHLQVWVPENRLDIQLSDYKLNPIKQWKVRLDIQLSDYKLNPIKQWKVTDRDGTNRSKRGADFGMLTHPGTNPKDKISKVDKHGCKLRLQQSQVEVYARFIIQSATRTDYYHNRKAYLRVTNLVRNRLRISDTKVATLNGTVIEGHRQGKTEVQVLAPSGRIMGIKELKVVKNKIHIERLLVRVISGISMDISKERNLMDSLTAVAHLQDKLTSKHQEGILDVTVQYSDGTRFPLEHISPDEFNLVITSLNNHVVDIPTNSTNHKYSIIAVDEGRGELVRVELRKKDPCDRKRSRPLATSYVYVNVDFSKETNYFDLQSDSNYDNRASDRLDKNGGTHHHKNIQIPFNSKDAYFKYQQKSKVKVNPRILDQEPQVIPAVRALDKLPESQPKDSKPESEAQQQPLSVGGLSPLEIGMYVLLAVFCVAILVFTVNCAVFMMRYRRKRMPSKYGKIKKGETARQANDWVWIGRQTLERNAINTRCSHALMPEEDFNGNRMIRAPSSGSGSNNSSNRNSTVSTYKGSECSIRITANPLPDRSPGASIHDDTEWDYEAMGMTYDQLMEYFDNLKESTA